MQVRLLDRDLYASDPYPAYAWLRANQPVYWDADTGLWGLALHEDVVWGETHPDLLSSANGSQAHHTSPLHMRRRFHDFFLRIWRLTCLRFAPLFWHWTAIVPWRDFPELALRPMLPQTYGRA